VRLSCREFNAALCSPLGERKKRIYPIALLARQARHQAVHEAFAGGQLGFINELVRLVRLGYVARAADDGGDPCLLKYVPAS